MSFCSFMFFFVFVLLFSSCRSYIQSWLNLTYYRLLIVLSIGHFSSMNSSSHISYNLSFCTHWYVLLYIITRIFGYFRRMFTLIQWYICCLSGNIFIQYFDKFDLNQCFSTPPTHSDSPYIRLYVDCYSHFSCVETHICYNILVLLCRIHCLLCSWDYVRYTVCCAVDIMLDTLFAVLLTLCRIHCFLCSWHYIRYTVCCAVDIMSDTLYAV